MSRRWPSHSTPAARWPAIQRDGALKSWAVLKRERSDWEPAPIGLALGDPVDFREYIMLSSGSVSSELVVLSKQKGHILMDGDARYETGVRLYLDAGKIARDGGWSVTDAISRSGTACRWTGI